MPADAQGGFHRCPNSLTPRGGSSGLSGPWHSCCSMWKIHFPWLKRLASSPLIPQSSPQQQAGVNQWVRGHIWGIWGEEGSRHNDCSLSPRRILSRLQERETLSALLMFSVCVFLYHNEMLIYKLFLLDFTYHDDFLSKSVEAATDYSKGFIKVLMCIIFELKLCISFYFCIYRSMTNTFHSRSINKLYLEILTTEVYLLVEGDYMSSLKNETEAIVKIMPHN